MHHIKGLVRTPSLRTLRQLEKSNPALGCTVVATLMDCTGATAPATLLRPLCLVQLLEQISGADVTQQVRDVTASLQRATAPQRAIEEEAAAPVLYVKGTAQRASEEVNRRQLRLLSRLEGKALAKCIGEETHTFVRELLEKSASGVAVSEEELARYRGLVEGLCDVDGAAAMALAINPNLPLLHSGANNSLAKLVEVRTPSAVSVFLEGLSAKDDAIPASETAATQLAARLRAELAQDTAPQNHSSSISDVQASLQSSLLECGRFNVDPGSVYPTDARAIQAWATQYLRDDMLPFERAETVGRLLVERSIQPRRLTLTALSVWCLSDLGRAAFTHALGPAEEMAEGRPGDLMAAYHSTATALALKDARRNLVDCRLLHHYAALLSTGAIAATDDSFAAFVEECGECRLPTERPDVVRFTMTSPPALKSIESALRGLAPRSAYWQTLIQHFPERVDVCTAPHGELLVSVHIPSAHECMTAANSGALPLPELPVIFEDEHALVINKPAGLATTRHGLAVTQRGGDSGACVDVMSVLLSGPRGPALRHVFRQGLVHRLDRGTSGCLFVAKSQAVSDSVRQQMGTSGAYALSGKVYVALCVVLEPSLKQIPLRGELSDPHDSKVRTKYQIIEFFGGPRMALVECRIQQGKKHQIRRHLASVGLPIIGDLEHGGAACAHPGISRTALHARCLSVVHPSTGEGMSFTAPYPNDMETTLRVLRKQQQERS